MRGANNYETLIKSASCLIRQRGYYGVGLTEILAVAALPKGSLYYHFPNGKPELAAAATLWAGRTVEALVDRCFERATDFRAGAGTVCLKIAAAISEGDRVPACPVMSVLPAVTSEPALREAAQKVYADWTACIARHAARFGEPEPDRTALDLHIRLQGAWILAFAEQSPDPFLFLAGQVTAANI